MKDKEVKKYWDANAEAWTVMSRAGYDLYRQYIHMPGFLQILGNVNGLKGLDIGCGEGYNTRTLAGKGAHMIGFDISEKFIRYAQEEETKQHSGITYSIASGSLIPFKKESFDFCVAIMSLMDMHAIEAAIAEVYRVLKHGGFFQFSITHPCFDTPVMDWVRDEHGRKIARACGDYFHELNGETIEWTFGAASAEFKKKYDLFITPRFTRTLSNWLNTLIKCGFTFERFHEPYAGDDAINQHPHLYDSRVVAYFLVVRCRK